ncbi:MAG: hypothetical protein ABH821_04640 [archaeon]
MAVVRRSEIMQLERKNRNLRPINNKADQEFLHEVNDTRKVIFTEYKKLKDPANAPKDTKARLNILVTLIEDKIKLLESEDKRLIYRTALAQAITLIEEQERRK